jgi:hypothetical protein
VHGAAFIVHESKQSYLLMSGMDTQLRSSGAISLLVFEAIRRSATVSGAFDFAGSMIESVERFNRGFGARQQPYLHVRRTRRPIQPLLAARDELRGWRLPYGSGARSGLPGLPEGLRAASVTIRISRMW